MDEPTAFRAGDSVAWTVSLPDYPATSGWTLKCRLLAPSGIATDLTVTPNGDDYDVSVSPANSANWPAGSASLVKIVENDPQRITLGASPVTILPNLATVGNFDGRTPNAIALADAEAALAAHLAGGKLHVESYTIGDRAMKFRTVQDIRDLIAHYRAAVVKETALQSLFNGGQPPGRCYYRAG